MLDAPVESTYLWFGLALASASLLGLAVNVPTAPPPDATMAARSVDRVAASPYEAVGRHPLDASRIRLGAERIGLAGPGGAAHAAFAYDSVVPVPEDGRLTAVLRGTPPDRAFDDRSAFAAALKRARTTEPRWRPAPERLLVRRVAWEEVNGTLVGT